MIEANSFLGGLRVIDVGHYISGPFCARLMASFGAEVVKVEPPWGDASRRLGPFPHGVPDREKSGHFHYLNAGKQGVTLNLKQSEDREVFLKLVATADVVVENFEPRVLPSLGLSYESLRSLNSRLVLTSVSNFGQTGPYRDYHADEIGIQATSGLMRMTGEPDRAPLKKGGSFGQYLGGANAFSATMAALYQREDTGEGAHVDLSLAETYASIHGRGVKLFSYSGQILRRMGSHARPYPSGAYPCANGYVAMMGPMGQPWWPRFSEMIDAPELLEPPYSEQYARANPDEVDVFLLPWLAMHTKEEVVQIAQQYGIAAGLVATASDLLASEQLAAREFFVQTSIDRETTVPMPGMPYILTGAELPELAPAPRLGQDNQRIFSPELGLSRDQLEDLARSSVIQGATG